MKRITHWQAALAVCVSLVVAFGSLLLFNLSGVNQMIPFWISEWMRNETHPEVHLLNDCLFTRIVVSDGIFVAVVWGIIGVKLWRLLGRTTSTPA